MEIGPVLPPHLAKTFSERGESVKDELELETGISINKQLDEGHKGKECSRKRPSDAVYGPLLPSQFEPKLGEGRLDQDSDEDECHGPALPPGFQRNNQDRSFRRVVRQKLSHDSDSDNGDGDCDVIGPMPLASSVSRLL